jgi:Mn-dependent DtxR family transcriptional regulator
MKYHESEEMYLETILLLAEKGKEVRSIDIATELNYSRASVSRAMGLLVKKEYITIDNSIIKFTDLG